MCGVLDGLHAGCDCSGDVFRFVVDKENIFGRSLEALGGVLVDLRLGLGAIDGVGPGVVVEGLDPCVAGTEPGLHGVGHVGEDAGADAGALELVDPGEHGRVEGGPEVGVGGDELSELCGGDDDASPCGGFVPEGFGVEVAAVVRVAVGPVLAVEELFAETCDGAQVGPGVGVRLAGEDHAVVEEDCFY